MKYFKSLALILTLTTPMLSNADTAMPWCHIPLRSTDGTVIQFDYSKYVGIAGRFGTYWTAQPWIQVSGPGIHGSERVRAVVISRKSGFNRPAQIFDLNYDAGQRRFTGQTPSIEIVQTGPTAATRDRHVTVSLAVVVNGDWKSDPISGSSDFEIDLDRRPGQCDQ